MTANDYFKKKRTEKEYSTKEFAELLEIPVSSIIKYESADFNFLNLSTGKVCHVFFPLDIDIPWFFNEYYNIYNICEDKIAVWKKENRIEDSIYSIKKKINNRILKIESRKSLPADKILIMKSLFEKNLHDLCYISKGNVDKIITAEEYEKYIIPILYVIRKGKNTISNNNISDIIMDKLYYSRYSEVDLALFCGVSKEHVCRFLKDETKIKTLKISSFLILCYILGIDFDILKRI